MAFDLLRRHEDARDRGERTAALARVIAAGLGVRL